MAAEPTAATTEFRQAVFDALAEFDGCGVMDLDDGRLAVVDLGAARVYIVTVQEGKFEVAS